MNPYYTAQNPLTRRATVPLAVAPTASMIDPNLDHPSLQQHSQLQQRYGDSQMHLQMQLQMQNNTAMPSDPFASHRNPAEQSLPSKDVNDQNIDTAYVDFILYCNPSISKNVDTTGLRKGFRTPPKSDGKIFSPFILFQLIVRLEDKDLKTWTQLVIELGVVPPDPTKNQSSQKVQQYAVRLKRWLHAFHVDAFFNYLHGTPNSYYTERPTTEESLAEIVRDGVPPEEDLAVRALLPEWRPKRGRRKAEDIEPEAEDNISNKKTHMRSSNNDFTNMFDDHYSAAPSTAMPWSALTQQTDPWALAQTAIASKASTSGQTATTQQLNTHGASQDLRWQFDSNHTPSNPYPQSAITPKNVFSGSPSFDEPRSDNPTTRTSKSPSRSRRKNGSAVSSAWPSTNAAGPGKIRGRPPSNRSVQDGPFSTFPANPNAKENPNVNVSTPIQSSPSPGPSSQTNYQTAMGNSTQATRSDQNGGRKPSKLQLQVPEHSGGPVRLATPPRLLINGESNAQAHFDHDRRSSEGFFNQLDEVSEEDAEEDVEGDDENIDWKRRALTLKRKLIEKEEEFKALKRRVLDAVM